MPCPSRRADKGSCRRPDPDLLAEASRREVVPDEGVVGGDLGPDVVLFPTKQIGDGACDLKILEAVETDGRISITDLAVHVGLSKTPCQIRFKRLIKDGYIQGFKAILNPAKLELDHVAFAEVKLTNTHEDALRDFNAAVRKIREVEECHMIAGRFDYLLKVRTRDIRRYRRVLGELISTLPNVASTSTNVVKETGDEGRVDVS